MDQGRKRWRILFTVYVVLMGYLLFLQRVGNSVGMEFDTWLATSVNLVPGRTIWNLVRGAWNGWFYRHSTDLLRFAFINHGGNILLFIPLGIFLPVLWRRQRRWGWFVLTVTVAILLVETIQLLTMLGSWDVDDLILNVFGAVLGFAIWRGNQKHQVRKDRGYTGNWRDDMIE